MEFPDHGYFSNDYEVTEELQVIGIILVVAGLVLRWPVGVGNE